MSKPTPGPWEIIDQYIIAADESVICQWESYTDKANARLIAATPDLLDLARNVAGLDPAHVEKIDGHVLVVNAIREWIEQARAAIAKAEGVS